MSVYPTKSAEYEKIEKPSRNKYNFSYPSGEQDFKQVTAGYEEDVAILSTFQAQAFRTPLGRSSWQQRFVGVPDGKVPRSGRAPDGGTQELSSANAAGTTREESS